MNAMILFRADANPRIGSGHIMRTLSLASALRARGANCAFVCADDAARELIANAGFRQITLGTDRRNMPEELPAMRRVITDERPDLLIVDSYCVTADYLISLRQSVRLAYIDDVDAFRYPVDCLINYNVSAGDAGYEKRYPADTALLLGMDYVPLRPEFQDIVPVIRPEAGDVLILTGGADPLNTGAAFLETLLSDAALNGLRLHIVVGALNDRSAQILDLAARHERVVVHQSVTGMAALMGRCDAAISAGGSTLYELCACGVPTICYTFADNQIPLAKGFEKRGLMTYAGDIRFEKDAVLAGAANALRGLICSASARAELSGRMRAVIDGRGANRLAAALLAPPWADNR